MKYLIRVSSVFLLALSLSTVSFAQTLPGDYPPANTSQNNCVDLPVSFGLGARDISTNGAVSSLQNYLSDAGYFTGEPTGYFGNITSVSVKKFQTAQNFAATGYVGPLTRAAIKKATCSGAIISTSPTISPAQTYSNGCVPGALFSQTTGQACVGRPGYTPSSTPTPISPSSAAPIKLTVSTSGSTVSNGSYPAYLSFLGGTSVQPITSWKLTYSCPSGIDINTEPGTSCSDTFQMSNTNPQDFGNVMQKVFWFKNNSGSTQTISMTLIGYNSSNVSLGTSYATIQVPVTGTGPFSWSKITLLSPNGGQVFQAGQTMHVTWATQGASLGGTIKVVLIKGNALQFSQDNLANNGSVNMILPTTASGSDYKLEVDFFEPNQDYPHYADDGDQYFTINPIQQNIPTPTPVPTPTPQSLTSLSVAAPSSSVTPITNGSNTTSALMTFGFTLQNNGNNDVYISKTPSSVLVTTASGFSAVGALTYGGPNSTLAGDTSSAFMVPSGSSRAVTYTGTLSDTNPTSGIRIFRVTAINFGTSASSPTGLSVTSGLGSLYVTALFSGTSANPTPVPTPAPTPSSPSISVTSPSASVTPVTNGSNTTSALVTFGFTLQNNGNNDVYISKTPSSALVTSASGFSAIGALTYGAANSTFPGDMSGAFIIPSGSSRSFTYTGIMSDTNPATGNRMFRITGINFGTNPNSPTGLSVTSGLNSLYVTTLFSSSSSPTPTPVPTPTPTPVVPTPTPGPAAITLTAPNGGTYRPGDTITISWIALGLTGANNGIGINVYQRSLNPINSIIRAYGSNTVSNGQISNTGSYSFIVPSNAPSGNDYMIYLGTTLGWVESNSFTISSGN